MNHRFRCVIVRSLSIGLMLVSMEQLAADDRAAVDIPPEILDRICSPEDSADAREANELLWATDTENRVRTLLFHEKLNVSLRAAWRRAIMNLRKDDESDHYYRPSEGELQRFLGFAEGKVGVPLPDWWTSMILQAESSDQSRIGFYPDAVPYYPASEIGTRSSEGIVLRRTDAGLTVALDGEVVTLPQPVRYSLDAVTAIRVGNRVIAAAHSDSPQPYQLYCFDSVGAVEWSSTVWVMGEQLRFIGRGHQYVQLYENDGVLYAFGGTSLTAYLEAFRITDGSPVFRFSTSY